MHDILHDIWLEPAQVMLTEAFVASTLTLESFVVVVANIKIFNHTTFTSALY